MPRKVVHFIIMTSKQRRIDGVFLTFGACLVFCFIQVRLTAVALCFIELTKLMPIRYFSLAIRKLFALKSCELYFKVYILVGFKYTCIYHYWFQNQILVKLAYMCLMPFLCKGR